VGREVDVLSKVERRKKRQKLRGEMVSTVIKMGVKVTCDDEFVRCGIASMERNELKTSINTEYVLEKVDKDEGRRC